jgi:hypothetical protein
VSFFIPTAGSLHLVIGSLFFSTLSVTKIFFNTISFDDIYVPTLKCVLQRHMVRLIDTEEHERNKQIFLLSVQAIIISKTDAKPVQRPVGPLHITSHKQLSPFSILSFLQ